MDLEPRSPSPGQAENHDSKAVPSARIDTPPTAKLWKQIHAESAADLVDARLQIHHAAQFASAIGISYLAAKPDDSHTNLGWDTRNQALSSREVRALSHSIRVALRPADLTLLVLVDGSVGQRIALHGSTVAQTDANLRSALAAVGLDGRRLTLKRHFTIPAHPVARHQPFDITLARDFEAVATWFGNAALVLGELARRRGSGEVRCWPHHFDLATLATIGEGRTSGAGFVPGDGQYPEPYFYVNANPRPSRRAELPALPSGGFWNTEGWFGAVLRSSSLHSEPQVQERQVEAFLTVASDACAGLLDA